MEKQLEFPMDIYPPPLRQIIEDTHRDLNFPVNYIASSLLLAVSVAVGNSRVLKVRDGWRVKPILYMALVGSPGSVKTHPVSFALAPFRRSDDYTLGKYAAELEKYRRQMMTERGEKPKAKQFIVKDSTIEAVAKVLHSNPHGICVHSDELNGWLGSFDKYHRSGGDQEQWLSMFNGDAIVVNRKSQDDIISVPSPFVSVIGSIQPSVLTKCFKGQKVENGFLFRILFVNNSSEGQPMRWPEDDLPSDAEGQWYGFLMSLLETSKAYDETRKPKEYTFNPLAWDIIRTWQNLKEDELAETGEEYQIATRTIGLVPFHGMSGTSGTDGTKIGLDPGILFRSVPWNVWNKRNKWNKNTRLNVLSGISAFWIIRQTRFTCSIYSIPPMERNNTNIVITIIYNFIAV